MNKLIWILLLPFTAPIIAIGFLCTSCAVAFGIGIVLAKSFWEWIGKN